MRSWSVPRDNVTGVIHGSTAGLLPDIATSRHHICAHLMKLSEVANCTMVWQLNNTGLEKGRSPSIRGSPIELSSRNLVWWLFSECVSMANDWADCSAVWRSICTKLEIIKINWIGCVSIGVHMWACIKYSCHWPFGVASPKTDRTISVHHRSARSLCLCCGCWEAVGSKYSITNGSLGNLKIWWNVFGTFFGTRLGLIPRWNQRWR